MKTCVKCKEEKPFDSFYKHPTCGDGHFRVCKPCFSERENLKYRLKIGFSALKTDYCECCGQSGVKVDLDHCHESGMFRGFICRPCNKKISLAGDTYVSLLEGNADQMYLDYLRLANYRMGKVV